MFMFPGPLVGGRTATRGAYHDFALVASPEGSARGVVRDPSRSGRGGSVHGDGSTRVHLVPVNARAESVHKRTGAIAGANAV